MTRDWQAEVRDNDGSWTPVGSRCASVEGALRRVALAWQYDFSPRRAVNVRTGVIHEAPALRHYGPSAHLRTS